MSSEYDDEHFILSEADPNVERCAPTMERDELRFFSNNLQSEIVSWSTNSAFAGTSGSQSASDDDEFGARSGENAIERAERRYREKFEARSKRERQLDDNELNSILRENRRTGKSDRFMSTERPDLYSDLNRMMPFRVFEESWIPYILSEPLVRCLFVYLQPIACKGMGGVHPQLYPTLYGAENYGTRVDIIEEEEHCVRARIYFAPRVLDGKENSKMQIKSTESSTGGKSKSTGIEGLGNTAQSNEAVISSDRRIDGYYASMRMSLAETVQADQVFLDQDNDAEYDATIFRRQRAAALTSQRPYKFFWDKKTPTTMRDVAKATEQKIEDMVNKFGRMQFGSTRGAKTMKDDGGSDSGSSSSSSDDESDDDASSASNIEIEDDVIMPGRRSGDTLSSLSSDVLKNLSRSAVKKSKAVLNENPDSIARSRTEISGWVEDCLCIDVVIFPGLKKKDGQIVQDDKVQGSVERQLIFSFAICKQNPYSFSELVRKGLKLDGGVFPEKSRVLDDIAMPTNAEAASSS